MNLKECIQEALERYDRYTANENMSHAGMAQMVTDALSTFSTEIEKRYRKALEEIGLQTSYVGGKEMPIVIIKMHDIARQALSSSPSPEPVTMEELAQELASSYEGYSILKDSFYLNTAKHLLTKFKIERKGGYLKEAIEKAKEEI